jgi:6-phosphogluconolactonase
MKTIPHISFALIATLMLVPASIRAEDKMQPQGQYFVYVGTAIYEGQSSKNLYRCRFDAATGKLSSLEVAAETINPGFVAIHPNGRFLYTTNEVGNYKSYKGGAVSAYALDRTTGQITFLNDVFSGGANPAHLTIDKTGRYVLAANYYGGKAGAFPILEDGRLGEASSFVHLDGSSVNKERQDASHPHSVYVSPDNRFVLVPNLGLDKVLVYRFDATNGQLTPNDPPFASVNPGAGSRHLAFSKNGKFVYVIDELQSTISAFSYDARRGVLHPLQTISTLPKDFKGENTDAEVEVSSDGKFLYNSNRGHDSITVFGINPQKGTLTPLEHVPTQGKTPRHFAIDPTHSYLLVANQDSNNIVVFRVDTKSGRLTPTGEELKLSSPTCIVFVAAK